MLCGVFSVFWYYGVKCLEKEGGGMLTISISWMVLLYWALFGLSMLLFFVSMLCMLSGSNPGPIVDFLGREWVALGALILAYIFAHLAANCGV